MKRIFVVILLSVFAFTAGSKLNKSDSKKYKTGIEYFENKQYEKSYRIFDSLFWNNLTNSNVNFYLGRSAFETKNYDIAISTYERILITDKNNFKAQLELARTFLAVQDYKSSKEMFEKIKRNNKSKKVVNIINKYLEKIKEAETKKASTNFQGIFIFKIGNDTNIHKRPSANSFFIPAFNVDFKNITKDEKSIYNQEIIVLGHKYINGKFNIKNNLLILNKHFYSSDKKAIQIFSYSPSFGYQHKQNLKSDLKFHIAKTISGSEENSNNGITPELSYIINKTNILITSLKYQNNDAEQTLNNSNAIDFNLNLKNIISPQIITFSSLKLGTLKHETNNSHRDYNTLQLILGLSYQVSNKLSFQLKGDYKYTQYKEVNKFYKSKQVNNDMTYSLSSNYSINKQWMIKGVVSYLDVKSNIPSSVYNKYDISLSILRYL